MPWPLTATLALAALLASAGVVFLIDSWTGEALVILVVGVAIGTMATAIRRSFSRP